MSTSRPWPEGVFPLPLATAQTMDSDLASDASEGRGGKLSRCVSFRLFGVWCKCSAALDWHFAPFDKGSPPSHKD